MLICYLRWRDLQVLLALRCAQVLAFFESQGFKCPPRKGVADFLQEVTSPKDQAQYWCATTSDNQTFKIKCLYNHVLKRH